MDDRSYQTFLIASKLILLALWTNGNRLISGVVFLPAGIYLARMQMNPDVCSPKTNIVRYNATASGQNDTRAVEHGLEVSIL